METYQVKTIQVMLLASGLLLICVMAFHANAQSRNDSHAVQRQIESVNADVETLDRQSQEFRLQIEKRLVAIETEFTTIKNLLWAVVVAVGAHLGTSLLNLLLRKPREG